nr:MAG TPA: hypothetical protein [Caudoviricetes sp.]
MSIGGDDFLNTLIFFRLVREYRPVFTGRAVGACA